MNVEQKTTVYEDLTIFTDGGSRGNPGQSASGYVFLGPNQEVIETGGEYLGITTNNQAEYQAVKLALEQAEKYQPKRIQFFIDSELVVKQMNGQYRIRNRDLWPIHSDIKRLATNYESVSFSHVRREHNELADAEVNRILDEQAAL
jgi:ribonuclease HI